jgi:DNA-binding NtrC family response regulator
MHTTGTILLGKSVAIDTVRCEIAKAAPSHAKVLILGETGVGKEVVARSIHDQSARRNRPFVAINCSGIPETLLESELFGHTRGSFTGAYRDKPGVIRQAQGGTLFLDELGEMSLRMQAMLLRFAETGEIHAVGSDRPAHSSDVRLITATNRDLRERIAAGAFREDLYYRLNVIRIEVAPLRDRADDVPVLLEHYLRVAAASHHSPIPVLAADAEAELCAYAWPGNVRELRNMAERLVLAHWTRPITAADLPFEMRDSTRAIGRVATQPEQTVAAPMRFEPSSVVEQLFARFASGEDFWTAVHQPFKVRGLTRQDLATVIDHGLRQTDGSYRSLLRVFNLPPSDYKRLHGFLYQQKCNLPVAPYRRLKGRTWSVESGERRAVA